MSVECPFRVRSNGTVLDCTELDCALYKPGVDGGGSCSFRNMAYELEEVKDAIHHLNEKVLKSIEDEICNVGSSIDSIDLGE